MTDPQIPGTRFVHGSSDTILVGVIHGLEELGITQMSIPSSSYTILSREPLVIQVPVRYRDFTFGEVPWHDALDRDVYPTADATSALCDEYFVQDLHFERSHRANRWSYTDAYWRSGDAHRLGTFKYEGALYLSIGSVITPVKVGPVHV
jgi:hypothetical protein